MKIWRRAVAAVAAMLAGVGAATIRITPAWAAIACEVTYYQQSTWSTGFYGNAQIKNIGDETWHSPVVTFTLPNGQITQGWNQIWSQSGTEVTARSNQWGPAIPPGETLHLGFIASYTGTNLPPTNWRVNGVACTMAGQPPAVTSVP
jgi:cellulase/cellobiase CelA1